MPPTFIVLLMYLFLGGGYDDEFSCERPHFLLSAADEPALPAQGADSGDDVVRLTCIRSDTVAGTKPVDPPQEPVVRHLLWDRPGGTIQLGPSSDPFHVQSDDQTQSLLFPAGAQYGPISVKDRSSNVVKALHACRLFAEENQMQCGYFSAAEGAPIAVHDFDCSNEAG